MKKGNRKTNQKSHTLLENSKQKAIDVSMMIVHESFGHNDEFIRLVTEDMSSRPVIFQLSNIIEFLLRAWRDYRIVCLLSRLMTQWQIQQF